MPTWSEVVPPVQDGLNIPVFGFGKGNFGHFIFGHSIDNEGDI